MESKTAPICIVVPCYNEAARLNLDAFRSFATRKSGVRLLFVDDGSSDKTLDVLQMVRQDFEDTVAILPCPKNGGKGEAVRLGILHAIDTWQPEIVGFWDADLATPLAAIGQLSDVLRRMPEIEMVFGSRVKLLGREVERRAIRHYPGRVFATVVSTLLRMSIYDTQCGAKLFRVMPWTRSIFAEPFVSKWVFDVEIIARYINQLKRPPDQMAATIYEFPLEKWTDVAGSKLHPSDFLLAFFDVLKIYRKYL